MRKILSIAKREFLATVMTRAFIIALLIVPAMGALLALVLPRLINQTSVQMQGEIRVIDPTNRVMPELQKSLSPAGIAKNRQEEAGRILRQTPPQMRALAAGSVEKTMDDALQAAPRFRLVPRPATADIEEEKKWLHAQRGEMPPLALVVIHRNAVVPADGSLNFGAYDFFVPPKLDDRIDGEIQRGFREAIVNARLQARALDRSAIDAIIRVPMVHSITVTPGNQRATVKGMNFLFPVAFGLLLFMGVMGGGGQLLTTMVEEKSSRVVEVLLSAVSPMELMAGKLLGQMGASMLGMCLYMAMGLVMLSYFALMGLLNISLIFYLILFFIITYLVMGSIMMAAGASVNDMKEAQGLLAPLTIMFVIPWILWMPISADPNSTLSITMSFLPPVNTFAMLLRMASTTPPPLWQVWLSTGIGIASAFCALWCAAKVFRIGLLMFGKPPNLATLIRWIRSS